MAKFNASDVALYRAILLGTVALALAGGPAWARIGVTSATDGDPLGKPPSENERVLRIGIDVQADEVITTNASDRAHLVFLDGTSVTVGPNARLSLDKFVYDPDTKKGELALTASKGVFRIVGGKISKTNAITVTTPSSTIGIRGGISIFTVTSSQTVSTFVFGQSLTVNGSGQTQTLTRAGTQVVTNFGGTPGNPTPVPPGSLNGSIGALEGNTGTGGNNQGDQQSQNSGFSNQNSGQGPTSNPPPPPVTNVVSSTTNSTTSVVTNSNPSNNPGTLPTETTTTIDQTQTVTQTTSVVVSRGRFLQDKPYLPETFNRSTLSAAHNPQNNELLNSPSNASYTTTTNRTTTTTTTKQGGVVTSSTSNTVVDSVQKSDTIATISTGTGSLDVPWMPGQIFQFNGTTPFGPATAVGLVAENGDFFAYSFVVTASGQKFVLFGGTPTTTSQFPKVGIGAQALTNLNTPGNLPFAPDSVGGDSAIKGAAKVSPLYSVYTPNLSNPTPGQSVPSALQVTISIPGTSVTQKSYMGLYIANYGTDSATNTVYGAGTYLNSYRLGANQNIGSGISNQASADAGTGLATYGSTGQYQVYVPDKIVTSGGNATRTSQAALDLPQSNATGTSYYPVTMATPVPDPGALPSDLGQNRTTRTMNGYATGLIEARNGNSFNTRVPLISLSKPTDVSISTDAATNQAMATLVLRAIEGTQNSTTVTLELGGKSGANGPVSAFIDDKRFAMITQTNDSNRQSKVQVGNGNASFTLNDKTLLASYNTAPVNLPGGVSPCTCEYLSWGFWSTNMTYSSGPRSGQTDSVNLGAYVVGQLTTALQMPQTGTATYTGFMVGNVQNGSNAYIGTGTYTSPWNFASRSGSFNATFDGTNYTGNASAQSGTNGASFSSSLSGGGRTGSLVGSFFGPQAQNQGGLFSIGANNTTYKAAGIFAGQKTGP